MYFLLENKESEEKMSIYTRWVFKIDGPLPDNL